MNSFYDEDDNKHASSLGGSWAGFEEYSFQIYGVFGQSFSEDDEE